MEDDLNFSSKWMVIKSGDIICGWIILEKLDFICIYVILKEIAITQELVATAILYLTF